MNHEFLSLVYVAGGAVVVEEWVTPEHSSEETSIIAPTNSTFAV